MVTAPVQCTMEDLADRAKSFDLFRKSYRKNEAMEDNRNLLKERAKKKELQQILRTQALTLDKRLEIKDQIIEIRDKISCLKKEKKDWVK